MSWSRTYGPGLLAALIVQARDEAPATKATIPEFEHAQVDGAIDAAEGLASTLPADVSSVTLSLSGHGWRNTVDGSGAGNVAVNVSYSVAAAAPLQPPTPGGESPAAVEQADGTGEAPAAAQE